MGSIFINSKKGIVMDVSIVFITLLFCSIVLGAYAISSKNLDASIVSPVMVLELSDLSDSISREEFSLLNEVYCSSSSIGEVKEKFCKSFDSLSLKSFLVEDSQPMGSNINLGNLCESIYSFSGDIDNLNVVRDGLVKKRDLEISKEKVKYIPEYASAGTGAPAVPTGRVKKVVSSVNVNKISNFPMRLNFRLYQEYLLTREDCN